MKAITESTAQPRESTRPVRTRGAVLPPPAYGVVLADAGGPRAGSEGPLALPAPATSAVPAGVQAKMAPVQADGDTSGLSREGALSIAAASTGGPAGRLPWFDRIQASFGRHDISGIRAHTGLSARQVLGGAGIKGLTRGTDVALADSDLHTAAHEAAHVVQQQAGVHLAGGVGQAGDRYERHADAVADAVVRGESAEPMLDAVDGGRPLAAEPGASPVQFKIGFEFEMGGVWSARATPHTGEEARKFTKELKRVGKGKSAFRRRDAPFTQELEIQRRDYGHGGHLIDNYWGTVDRNAEDNGVLDTQYRFHALSKKEKIVRGAGFTLEADEGNAFQGIVGATSNCEFVTDAFEENLEGRRRLVEALRQFRGIGERIMAARDRRHYLHAGELHGGGLVGIVVFPGLIDGALQVTGAVDLARVSRLMRAMSRSRDERDVSEVMSKGRSVLGKAIHGRDLPSPTGNAAVRAAVAIRNYRHSNRVPNGFGSKELEGLVALMASYIVTADSPSIGYAKTIAPLMARTSFARMFDLVPEKEHFEEAPERLVALVKDAADDRDMNEEFFPHGIYTNALAPGDRYALQGLTRRRWVEGIVAGTDYLTAKNFNDNPELEDGDGIKTDLESMGALGTQTEKVGQNGTDAPIFELRSLGQMPFDVFVQRTQDIFDYIVNLNQFENAPYVKRDTGN